MPVVLASFQELRRAKLPVIPAKATFWTQDSHSRALQRSVGDQRINSHPDDRVILEQLYEK